MSVQPLRDVILIEADALNIHAEILDKYASSGVARSVLEKQLSVAAIAVRQRAKMLNDVLEASEPKAEAGAS